MCVSFKDFVCGGGHGFQFGIRIELASLEELNYGQLWALCII
jgi:hypothetical protein